MIPITQLESPYSESYYKVIFGKDDQFIYASTYNDASNIYLPEVHKIYLSNFMVENIYEFSAYEPILFFHYEDLILVVTGYSNITNRIFIQSLNE